MPGRPTPIMNKNPGPSPQEGVSHHLREWSKEKICEKGNPRPGGESSAIVPSTDPKGMRRGGKKNVSAEKRIRGIFGGDPPPCHLDRSLLRENELTKGEGKGGLPPL